MRVEGLRELSGSGALEVTGPFASRPPVPQSPGRLGPCGGVRAALAVRVWQMRTQTAVLAVPARPRLGSSQSAGLSPLPCSPVGGRPGADLGRCSGGSGCFVGGAPRWRGLWARSAPCGGPGVGVDRSGTSPLSGRGNRWSRRERKPRVLLPAPCVPHTGLRPVLCLGPASALSLALNLLHRGHGLGARGRKRTPKAGWPLRAFCSVPVLPPGGERRPHTENAAATSLFPDRGLRPSLKGP